MGALKFGKVITAVTEVLDGDAKGPVPSGKKTWQATVTGTGAVAATVVIQGSNDGTNWLTIGTISLSGTTSDTDGFVSDAPWVYWRANVTAISGTGASVDVDGAEN